MSRELGTVLLVTVLAFFGMAYVLGKPVMPGETVTTTPTVNPIISSTGVVYVPSEGRNDHVIAKVPVVDSEDTFDITVMKDAPLDMWEVQDLQRMQQDNAVRTKVTDKTYTVDDTAKVTLQEENQRVGEDENPIAIATTGKIVVSVVDEGYDAGIMRGGYALR